MKKAKSAARVARTSPSASRPRAEMRAEYDFSGGVRGKYAQSYLRGSNVVVVEPDLVTEFPSANAVNRALRAYLKSKSAPRTR